MANHSSLDGVHVNDSTPPPQTPPGIPESVVSNVGALSQVESKAPGPGSPVLTFGAAEPAQLTRTPDRAMRTSAVASAWRRARLPIAVGLAIVALVEAIVIATMFVRQVPASPSGTVEAASTAAEAAVQPLITGGGLNAGNALTVVDQTGSSVSNATPDTQRSNTDAVAAAIVKAASNQRSGGVKLAAPIELKVLQGDRVLGSSADGPIVTTAGTHQLDFINTSFGFRARRAVTFLAGEITTLNIDVPSGSISVNAEPWAEVWIDNRPVGETPLAHLEIPVGEHVVVFRHPDLGERRQTVIVRADGVTRASATFE